MRIQISVLLMSTLLLSGCGGWGDSRANPRNWFGKSNSTQVVERAPTSASDRQTNNPLINQNSKDIHVNKNNSTIRKGGLFRGRNKVVPYEGTLVDEVTDLVVERIPTGAIVRVKGLPNREGAFDVRLLPQDVDGPVDGVMEYTLNAYQPVHTRVGTVHTREIEAGAYLSHEDLARIREIRVQAERNVRSTRR